MIDKRSLFNKEYIKKCLLSNDYVKNPSLSWCSYTPLGSTLFYIVPDDINKSAYYVSVDEMVEMVRQDNLDMKMMELLDD